MTQPEALRLADELEMWTLGEPAAIELRRLHAENEALREANEAFGKRQEWWNEKMFTIEQQRDALLEAVIAEREACISVVRALIATGPVPEVVQRYNTAYARAIEEISRRGEPE